MIWMLHTLTTKIQIIEIVLMHLESNLVMWAFDAI